MSAKVYFIQITDQDGMDGRKEKFSRLLDATELFTRIRRADRVAIKTHFGEAGNTKYVKPDFIKLAADRVTARKAMPVVTDSNALYHGMRTITKDHLKVAEAHGFTERSIGAAIAIAEGESGEDVIDVQVDQKFIKTAKVASLFYRADVIIGVSHFKGHILTGFGGALKNIGMGCASREGKLEQHSDVSPRLTVDNCAGCGICAESCPIEAISIIEKKARIDNEKCIGCAECIAVCPDGAIAVDWEQGAFVIQEKMAEYAKAILSGKRSFFINFAVAISQECDCFPKDFPVISPDAGIFISDDPVAIDKACMDTVIKICGRDVFREAHPGRDGSRQLSHASLIGMGQLNYDLIEIK